MNSRPIKILLVEDDEDDYVLVKQLLLNVSPSRFILDWVNTYAGALKAIGSGHFDLCLLDYRLGSRDGLELLGEIHQQGSDIPVILLTGQGNFELDLLAMRNGAADYLAKDEITSALLERSIRYAIEHKRTKGTLQTACTELDRKVRKRTRELTTANEQLTRINKELRREIVERQLAQEQVRSSLQEKEVLLQEIHHRVRNNLQVISSLLSLQIGSLEDRKTRICLRDSQNRIEAMALIHENLYQSMDLSKIHLREYVSDLATSLCLSYGADLSRIGLNVAVSDVTLGIDMAVPFGLMLNELVSNCLKHAFPENGTGPGGKEAENNEISIELRSEDGWKYTLTVSDNGIGLPEDLDWSRGKSLGLKLLSRLADQIDGQVEVKGDKGTQIVVTFYEINYRPRGLTNGTAKHPHSGR